MMPLAMESELRKPLNQEPHFSSLRRGTFMGMDFGGCGVKLVIAEWRHGSPRVLQAIDHRFATHVAWDELACEQVRSLIADELPRGIKRCYRSTTIVLPTAVALHGVHRGTPREILAVAAKEMVGGEVDWCEVGPSLCATYVCPGPFAQVMAQAVSEVGHGCERVASHPVLMRFAAELIGRPQAAVLDLGWNGCVVNLKAKGEGWLSRFLPRCGMHQTAGCISQLMGEAIEMAIHCLDLSVANSNAQVAQLQRSTDAVRAGMEGMAKELSHKLRETFRYAQRVGMEAPCELILCGGVGANPFLQQSLQDLLEIPTTAWRLPTETSSVSAPFALATAAALLPSSEAW